jgi:hypothetical protein
MFDLLRRHPLTRAGKVTSIIVAGESGNAIAVTAPSTNKGILIGAITVSTNGTPFTGPVTITPVAGVTVSLSQAANAASAVYPCSLFIGQTSATNNQTSQFTLNAVGFTTPTITATYTVSGSVTSTAVLLAGQSGPSIPVTFASTTNAGTLVGAVTVTTNPPGSIYAGTITLSGTNALSFSLSNSSNVTSASFPCSLYVAQGVNLAAGTYTVTLTATP